MENKTINLGIQEIKAFLPHRYPFLLVDRILEIQLPEGVQTKALLPLTAQVGTKVVGLKNVTANEPYFMGHFPDYPIVPGVLLVETMAQVASFSVYPSVISDVQKLSRDFQCILVGVDGARFRRPVGPGDTVRIETQVVKNRGKIWSFACEALVDGKKVAEAQIMANIVAQSGG